eukprot:TRINITY_DN43133_c0_g1_i1.p1 TRINITY_DN43133_c0_g1~~TRINITY_DN43133_c0_g1_i1.p1  ORF type:complete len:522 (-),score=69.16 TRINITY_DN43133_c0_g1_i1:197-1762(-)
MDHVVGTLLQEFAKWDHDGSGLVPRVDFVRALTSLPMNEEMIASILTGSGASSTDDKVDYKKLCAWLSRHPNGQGNCLPPGSVALRAASRDFKVRWAEPVKLDRSLTEKFLALDQGNRVRVEYVWIDEDYIDDGYTAPRGLCSKSMTLDKSVKSVDDLPIWSYSGFNDDDVMLVPRRIYRDPFRPGDNFLVMADTFLEAPAGSSQKYGEPTAFNSRFACDAVMTKAAQEDPWFGLEQEYFLLDCENGWPLGWPVGGYPGEHDAYYLAVGARKAPGRDVVEAHYAACLYAGVKISGVNGEVAPAQWEFQVGPCEGISAGDHLWMARYLLQRVCEEFHVDVTFDPKPVPGWAGIGLHTNYSTVSTRTKPGGMMAMESHIERLRAKHSEHMLVYGEGNELRLTGVDCVTSIDTFSHGVGRRDCSIRITRNVANQDCGYYEDRRPAANADPYLVTKMVVATTLSIDDDAAITGKSSGGHGSVPSSARSRKGSFIQRQANRLPSKGNTSRASNNEEAVVAILASAD